MCARSTLIAHTCRPADASKAYAEMGSKGGQATGGDADDAEDK
jgi:general stress protein YciG